MKILPPRMWVAGVLLVVLGMSFGSDRGLARAGLVITNENGAVSDELGTSQVRPQVNAGPSDKKSGKKKIAQEAIREAEFESSALDSEPVYQPKKVLSAEAQNVISGHSGGGAQADRGLSLNEIELRKMREEFTYRRNLAEAKKAPPSPKPAPKPAATSPSSMKNEMKTEVIGEKSEPAREPEDAGEPRGDEPNAAFVYTHLLPSPMNIPGGSWVLGSTAAIGVTDFLQLSTNILRDVTGYLNVQAKVPLIEYPTFIASAFVSWDHFNLNTYDKTNPDMKIRAWQPGLVTGYEISSDMAFFIGGNFNATNKKIPDNIRTSGYARGAQLEVDWSWLYNPASSRLGDNAISAGATYDFTYSLVGFGVTHHWPTFELGMHYVFNADRYRVLPLLNVSVGFTF